MADPRLRRLRLPLLLPLLHRLLLRCRLTRPCRRRKRSEKILSERSDNHCRSDTKYQESERRLCGDEPKEVYNKTPSHDTRHGTDAHWPKEFYEDAPKSLSLKHEREACSDASKGV